MREVLTITKYRWRGVRNDLAKSAGRRTLAACLIALNLFGALFVHRGFVALLEGWMSLGNDELFARSILLLLGILGVAYSLSLVSAAKEFLGRPQNPLLLVAPVRPSSLIWAKYLAVLVDRNLEIIVIVLGVPCLVAMQRVGLAHALYLCPLFLVSVLLINMAAVASVLFVARYVRRRRTFALGLGAGLLVLLLAWIVQAAHSGTASVTPGALLDSLQGWGIRWQRGLATRPFPVTVLCSFALLFILWILTWISSRIYVPAWSKLQEGRVVKPGLVRRPRGRTLGLVHRLFLPWQGATRAIVLKDWRTMGRSPLFPLRLLVLVLSWAIFSVVKERLAIHNLLVTVPLVVAYVLFCLQMTVIEPIGNAFAGEGNRLSLTLTAPLSPGRIVRAKLIAQLAPALLACAVSTFVIGVLVPHPPLVIGLAILLACLITGTNAILLVGGSIVATDLSAGVSGVLEEILFEETVASPIAAYRMLLMGVSALFQVANVVLLFLPYWWGKKFGFFDSAFWGGLVTTLLVLNGATAFGALRVGAAGLDRLTERSHD